MSKKKKGLSVDEKRNVVLGIYHELKEPFNLKEIEQRASKKGVVQQTIKEINQSLVDDFMVTTDKIGSANFFWSFPSKVYQDQVVQRENLRDRTKICNSKIAECKEQISQAKEGRNDPNRETNLRTLDHLLAQEAALDRNLHEFKVNDPAEICKIEEQTRVNKESADRWTDNVWLVKSYFTKKRGMSGKEADKVIGIDSSFDYITYDPNASVKKRK